MSVLLRIALLVVFAGCISAVAGAQSSSGTISGRVVDQTGAVVPGRSST